MATSVFAVERIDTWVFWVSITIPVVCLAALLLWHLVAFLAGKRTKTRKPARISPEPPERLPSATRLPLSPASPADAQADPINSDPQRLQQACAALEQSLAAMYLELAESWLAKDQPRQAAAALQRIVQSLPETPQARFAQDRLRQLRENT
jgi:hypothetical protein